MLILPRYILKAHVGPFVFSLVTLMFIFLLQFLMKFIDELAGKGLTPWVIIELITLSLAWMLVLAVPMSVLVATLMAFGDLSSRNEITAMKASGVSIYLMMAPVLIAAGIIGTGLVWFNNYVLPESNHRLKALTTDIRRKRPTLTLEAGVFSQDIPGYSMLVKKTHQKSNLLEGVTLYDYSNPNVNAVITAQNGSISFSSDYRKLILLLHTGEIHEMNLQEPNAYRRVRFETHRIAMAVEGFDFSRTSASAFSRGDRELSTKAMLGVVDSLENLKANEVNEFQKLMLSEMDAARLGRSAPDGIMGGARISPSASAEAITRARFMGAAVTTSLFRIEALNRQIDQYMVEIYKKYAIPTACVIFVLVGLPLGVMARRGGFGIAATLSLGFFVLYWACLIGGEKLADRAIFSPFVGMWAANILIGIVGIYLTIRIGRETLSIDWSGLQRFIPQRYRTRLRDEPASAD
jgi:lipopolysaccharide export system permease protein